MKDIEKTISELVKNQFPSFYEEEGPIFIAFVKAYYEWLEEYGLPGADSTNHLTQARSLTQFRDIDETLDNFIVHFKEKYLKNIQFDTATNKRLLVKNSLDLYRSKGTERSIDLFFKLVYGSSAEIKYPADKIFKPSNGIWEKPKYLEILPNKYNSSYIGKQIIGSNSGATAFVEKYIKRKTEIGYVDVFYISNIEGSFLNNESLGIYVNSTPTFDNTNTRVIGSVRDAIVISKGKNFAVGDLVSMISSYRGIDAIGRIANTSSATGIIDFNFEDGGYGYTLTANAIVSEKVLDSNNVISDPYNYSYAMLFDEVIQPNINIAFTSATSNLEIGTVLTRYSGGVPVSNGTIIDIDQEGANGSATISHGIGAFVNSATYYTPSNTISFYANTVEDRSITGKIMGIDTTTKVTVISQSYPFQLGDTLVQGISSNIFATGVITDINPITGGNVFTLSDCTGSFKKSKELSDFFYTVGSGTITANSGSATVTGSGTSFSNDFIESVIYETGSNTLLGTIRSITNTTSATLYANAAANVSSSAYATSKLFRIRQDGNTSNYANVTNVRLNFGLYDIKKLVYNLNYTNANNNSITTGSEIFQYDVTGDLIAKGKILTATFSANAGTITYYPTNGHFVDTSLFYVGSNTTVATISSLTVTEAGGDYISSPYSTLRIQNSNTYFNPVSISTGTGADFSVGSLAETETVVIGTDLLGGNNVGYYDNQRKSLVIASNTGFIIGDVVSQSVNKIAFNPTTALNTATGFITLPTANSKFLPGQIIRYSTAAGNTVLTGLSNNDFYYVENANTTGIQISYPWIDDTIITTTLVPDFADNAVNESGHYFDIQVGATVYGLGSGSMAVRDVYHTLGATGGTANTTTSGNSNIFKYTDDTVNTSITSVSGVAPVQIANQAYMSLLLRQGAYGFPKNTTGDIEDTIYSCLDFGPYEIGVISTIANVNPGSSYNEDQFVIVYEPNISAFDRTDFIISVENATRSYTVGEKVYQTLDNLIEFDLSVDDGARGNTYNEVYREFNSRYDVSNTADFIYVPSNTSNFNANTDVNNANDFITITDNYLANNDYVRYYTATGNTVLTGLSNNSFYYVVSANTTGIQLSTTSGGANIDITASATDEDGHYLIKYSNPYADDNKILYLVSSGNTAITGLTSNSLYYVVASNTVGFALSATKAGANINITANSTGGETQYISTVPGFLPGDVVYQNVIKTFNANTEVISDAILMSPQPFSDGDFVTYYTDAGNTAITELGNNSNWYVVSANSSTIKLSSTIGGNVETISATSVSETGHNIVALANGTVKSVTSNTVTIYNVDNTFANAYVLYSNTNLYVSANVSNVSLNSITSTAKGIVKTGSNTSVLYVKRLTFENTFQEGGILLGESSGSNSTILSVGEQDNINPIGLNAVVGADASTANGQISEIQIIDSGLAYTNNELVTIQLTSNTEVSASAKVVLNGSGISKGYYRSTRGFPSNESYIHDGDYYQEYSYEILSRIPVEKYSTMFKKVMHTAGTKFFGSVVVEEEESSNVEFVTSGIEQQVSFNAASDVSSVNETININIETNYRIFNGLTGVSNTEDFISITSNPYSNGSLVLYYTDLGNTAISGLSNNGIYYVVSSNTTGIKLSNNSNGSIIGLTAGISEIGHNFLEYKNPFSNNDLVQYSTATGNTVITGLANAEYYYIANTTPRTVQLSNTAGGNIINITTGSSEIGHYLTKIIEADD